MTAQVAVAPPVGSAEAEQAAPVPPIGWSGRSLLVADTGRGTTTIASRVVEKLAGRAAAAVPGAHDATIGGLPSLLAPLSRTPHAADADIVDGTIRLTLRIDAEWPAPLTTVARRARDAVRDTVTDLTGLQVAAIEVSVERFVRPIPRPAPRVR